MQTFNDREWWFWLERLPLGYRPAVIEALYSNGSITDWQLWDVLSHHQSPIPHREAYQVYKDLGFQPFAGYPLRRYVSSDERRSKSS